jgi:peptidoglycan/LPS O-acetylase OafA/YrhL
MTKPAHYPWLDVARGLSALLVVAGHCRAALFPPLASISAPTVIENAFYGVTSLGGPAVMAFFVLSGFLVGGSVVRAGERFTFANYAIARLCRLWVVLVPALLLTVIIDAATDTLAPGALQGKYFLQWNSGPDPGVAYSASFATFFGNLCFLQTITVPVFGSNGPLWSLANEFWYYVFFPLVAIGAWPSSRAARPISVIAAFVGTYLMPIGMLVGFVVWLLGMFAFIARGQFKHAIHPVWTVLSLVPLACATIYFKGAGLQAALGIDVNLVIGIGFAPFVFCIASLNSGCNASRLRTYLLRLGGFFSRISYSLYLSHFPVLLLIVATSFPGPQGRLSWQHFAIYTALLSGLCLFAWMFWLLFERHTDKLRTWVRGLVLAKSRPAT